MIHFHFTDAKERGIVSNSSQCAPEIIQSHQVHCLAKEKKTNATADVFIEEKTIRDDGHVVWVINLFGFIYFLKLDDKS